MQSNDRRAVAEPLTGKSNEPAPREAVAGITSASRRQALRSVWLGTALWVLSAAAVACGARLANHGGQVNDDAGELNFELVTRSRHVVVHVENHGDLVNTEGTSASLEITRGDTGWSVQLMPSGENRFAAVLPVDLLRGDKVRMKFSFPEGGTVNAHFTMGADPRSRLLFAHRPPDIVPFTLPQSHQRPEDTSGQ